MARGNQDYDQIRDAARHGNGAKFQMWGAGSAASGNVPMFDANGNLVDSSKAASGIGEAGGGGTSPYTAPTTADFSTWVNQGSAAATDATSGLILSTPSAAGDNWRMVAKALPAPPYTISIGIDILRSTAATSAAGVFLRESSTGKMVALYSRNSFGDVRIGTLASPTVASAVVADFVFVQNHRLWLRFQDDGANRIYLISAVPDDAGFIQLRSQLNNTYCVPDQICLAVYCTNGLKTVLCAFDYTEGV